MRVVIAGGLGRIGTALSEALVSRGDDVVTLTRRTAQKHPPAGVRVITWAPPIVGDWVTHLAGADAVINLAGASIARWPWTARRKALLRESRLASTRCLVEAIASLAPDVRPKVLLSASGTDLYEGRDAEPASEDALPGTSFLARLCQDWEAEASKAEVLGVRVVLARTASVIARDAPYVRAIALPFRLFLGGRLGSGQQWVSWVDRVDVVGLYLWALESDRIAGPLNVSAPDPRRQAEYAGIIGQVLHRPSRLRTPAWAIRLALRDQATLALGSRRVWPAKASNGGYVFRQPHLEESLGNALVGGEPDQSRHVDMRREIW
jgi:uncharacterized protein (TIGR01777 family)